MVLTCETIGAHRILALAADAPARLIQLHRAQVIHPTFRKVNAVHQELRLRFVDLLLLLPNLQIQFQFPSHFNYLHNVNNMTNNFL